MERKTHDAGRRLLLRQSLALAGAAAMSAPGCALATTYTCAVTSRAAVPGDAATLIALLTRDSDRDARRGLGFA